MNTPSPKKYFSDLLPAIEQCLGADYSGDLTVGLSGGKDSIALLHALTRWRDIQYKKNKSLNLNAIHIHHGLSTYADEWADFCTRWCEQIQVPLMTFHVQINPKNQGIESAARHARYAMFRQHTKGILLLAHHADDQAETLILAALRGGGLRAMSSMPEHRTHNGLTIVRPLLHCTSKQIINYIEYFHLDYVEDDSNQNSDFLRNWIRNQAFPALLARLPHARQHLLASVAQLQNDWAILEEIACADWQAVFSKKNVFNLKTWATFSLARRQQLLLRFAEFFQLGSPTKALIIHWEKQLFANILATGEWVLPFGKVWAYRGILYAWRDEWNKELFWQEKNQIPLHQLHQSPIQLLTQKWGLSNDLIQNGKLNIRTVQKNDMIHTQAGRKTVQKFLQDKHIVPALRRKWGVVVNAENQCVAVLNLAVSAPFAIENGILPVCPYLDFNHLNHLFILKQGKNHENY